MGTENDGGFFERLRLKADGLVFLKLHIEAFSGSNKNLIVG